MSAVGGQAAVAVGLAAVLWAGAAAPPLSAQDAELGRQIYDQGFLPSGQPLRGTVVGDVTLEGVAVSCAGCHRRSGFGTSEGGAYVPPVTAPWLFGADQPGRADLFRQLYQEVQPGRVRARLREPPERPPYTEETMVALLRTGRDPAGRLLDPVMPRYTSSDADLAHLVAYLKTLAAAPDPGADGEAVHFATVVTPGVDPAQRRAMLEVMEAYFRWKNADTLGQLQRPGHSPWHRDDFYRALRRWVLHVWQLEGPPERWAGQLAAFYAEQPVFALLSGLGAGDWRPVHELCERERIPCLFPVTDRPVVSEVGVYSLYLSRGPVGEAEALGKHLREIPEPRRIVEVHRERNGQLAEALRRSLGDASARLETRVIAGDQQLTPAFWASLLPHGEPSALVSWLGDLDLEVLAGAPGAEDLAAVYLSYNLRGETLPAVPASLHGKVHLTFPYALPGHEAPRIYRVRGWLRARRLPTTHERLRLMTYFALSIADHALGHLVENFSRDYFVENVEHEAESSLDPGVFPHLSLGPGQRFASKGCYVVRLTDGGVEAVSGWIVP